MTGPGWDDDRLLQELAEALRPPDVPTPVRDSARAAFTWRTVDAELAALTGDSSTAPELTTSVRGEAVLRTLVFSSSRVVLEVEVSDGGLVGQVVPPRSGAVDVLVPDGGRLRVDVDDAGTFEVRPVPRGPFRLVLAVPGETDVVTAWVTV